MPRLSVEKRKGSLYLYRRGRVNGRQAAQYLGPVTEAEVELLREPVEPSPAARARAEAADVDRAAGEVLAAGAEFEHLADRVFREAMQAAGFTLHRRSDWRGPRRGRPMKGRSRRRFDEEDDEDEFDLDEPGGRVSRNRVREGLVSIKSPDPKEQKILERARVGDKAAAPGVEAMIAANPERVTAWGSVAQFARRKLIREAAGDDLMLTACVERKVEEHRAKLAADCGPNPTHAERLTLHRVLNNWLAVHILECRLTDYQDATPAAAALERRLSQAERRLHASLKALATLRRLRGPAVTQVNVATTGNVLVNAPAGGDPALPGG